MNTATQSNTHVVIRNPTPQPDRKIHQYKAIKLATSEISVISLESPMTANAFCNLARILNAGVLLTGVVYFYDGESIASAKSISAGMLQLTPERGGDY